MSARAAAGLAWSIWAAIVGCLVAAVAISRGDLGPVGPFVSSVLFVLAFATVGALVASRRPGNPLGWLMCWAGAAFALGALTVTDAERGGSALSAWVGSWVWIAGLGPAITFVLLLFPTGRLPSRRWRAAAWVAGGGLALTLADLVLAPGPLDCCVPEGPAYDNPVGLAGAGGVLEIAGAGGLLGLLAAVVASIASLVVRFRRARRTERDQLKWLTYAAAGSGVGAGASIAIEVVAGPSASDLSNTIVSGAAAVLPVAIGIAILRHRLFDIDVVINRTLVYGGLTAILALAYLGAVLLLQLALGPLTEGNNLAVAGSTLVVAALFRPARARIQAVVDRRFYRRRYDAAQTLEAFSVRLREELDLDALGGDLRKVARETVQPAHVSLWLRSPR